VTTELAFRDYRAFPAPHGDELIARWRAVSADLGVPQSEGIPLIFAAPSAVSVGVNQFLKFDERESEDLSVWQTPAQTVARGSGDCKDYALLKYALLREMGAEVRIVIGEIRRLGMGDRDGNQHHAWCAAVIDGTWCALDNMFDHPEPVATYPNWTPLAACHDLVVTRFARGQEFTIDEELRKHGSV